MSKVETLERDLARSQAQYQALKQQHQTEVFIANAKRIKAEKEVAKLRMELALLKEGILA